MKKKLVSLVCIEIRRNFFSNPILIKHKLKQGIVCTIQSDEKEFIDHLSDSNGRMYNLDIGLLNIPLTILISLSELTH